MLKKKSEIDALRKKICDLVTQNPEKAAFILSHWLQVGFSNLKKPNQKR